MKLDYIHEPDLPYVLDMRHLAMAVGFTTGLLGPVQLASTDPAAPNAEEIMLVSLHRRRQAGPRHRFREWWSSNR
jgi:hypothetical protein